MTALAHLAPLPPDDVEVEIVAMLTLSRAVDPPWECPKCGKTRPGVYVKCPVDGTKRPPYQKAKK